MSRDPQTTDEFLDEPIGDSDELDAEAPQTAEYVAASITVLPGLEAVRQNPAMYIGSTDQEGVHQLVYEVVDNSIDESVAGYCTRIEVVLGEDGSCAVEDCGRGIPVEIHPEEGIPAVEVVMTRLHAGGKFGKGSYYRPAGIHGVGLSCVNALSEWLEVDIWRGGVHYRQRYARGGLVTPLQEKGPADKRGTRVCFKPDHRIFEETTAISYEVLARRLQELAFLHPGVTIRLEDRRRGSVHEYQYDSGILGFIQHLNEARTPLHAPPIRIRHRSEELELDLALQWTADYGEHVYSYVNSINTIYGGTHVSGLQTALTHTINEYAAETGMLSSDNGERITTFDIMEGLTAVLSLGMNLPRFEGQTKTRLTIRKVKYQVAKIVADHLHRTLREDSQVAATIVGRALDASRARLAARRASDRARFQNVATSVNEEVYTQQFGIRSKNWHDSALWITDEDLLKGHAELCKVGEGAVALDVCCGTGVVGASFKGKVDRVIGLDLTPEMVACAKTRLDDVVKGNVYEIPFEDESFDLVCTREVLHILPWPERPCSEIYRVLKPGGQFITGQILPYGEEDAVWMYRIFKKKQPLIFNMFQEEDFRALLHGSGFVDLEMTEYLQWESIDTWIDTHETTPLHRHEIRDLFANAPQEARRIHPFEILPTGEIRDLWRWCIFSVRKPE